MLNIFKKTKQVAVATEVITAKQIHEDFYGAEERLFVEAAGLVKKQAPNESLVSRFQKIGFSKVKTIQEAKQLESKKAVSENLVSAIEYFRTFYPHQKFITEDEVKRLCDKYGLLLGDAKNFTGDMPEKNLSDIEKFILRKEDWKEKSSYLDGYVYWIPQIQSEPEINGFGLVTARRSGVSRFEEEYRRQRDLLVAQYFGRPTQIASGVDPYASDNKKEAEKEQPLFKICAPKEDFNTLGYEVKDGYRLVYDPIVLQPVSKNNVDGYLIITAWGDEASDELVINEKQN